jgi:hypothetical protein
MKLVDILARELKIWPCGADWCEQDRDGEVRFSGTARADFFADTLADEDKDFSCADGIPWTGRVTREQWQAAVDALNAPTTWNGEGLPPVGTLCEVNHIGEMNSKGRNWKRVEILAHYSCDRLQTQIAIYMPLDGTAHCDQAIGICFRPIRTAEQIEAEERSLAVSEIISAIGWHHGTAGAAEAAERIYDAGYRKQASK